MIVFADNDILLKLARCDLFDEFLTVFNVTTADIFILRTARYSITTAKHRKRIGEASYNRLAGFINQISDIDVTPDPVFIAALTEQIDKNIDAGEAQLFAVCPLVPRSVIVTGDKKSLAGLTLVALEDEACQRLCHELTARVYCFEQIILNILNKFGFEAVRQKLIDGRECDRGLALWLGSGLNANERDLRDGIRSYLNEARRNSGALLAPEA